MQEMEKILASKVDKNDEEEEDDDNEKNEPWYKFWSQKKL